MSNQGVECGDYLSAAYPIVNDIEKYFHNKPLPPHNSLEAIFFSDGTPVDFQTRNCHTEVCGGIVLDVGRFPSSVDMRMVRNNLDIGYSEPSGTSDTVSIPPEILNFRFDTKHSMQLLPGDGKGYQYYIFCNTAAEKCAVLGRTLRVILIEKCESGEGFAPAYDKVLEVQCRAAMLDGKDPNDIEVDAQALHIDVDWPIYSQNRLVHGEELQWLRSVLGAGALVDCICEPEEMETIE